MSEKPCDWYWPVEFYWADPSGTRTSVQNGTVLAPSLEQVIEEAKSMMQNITFPSVASGKANRCLIKKQDGRIVREVIT